MGAGAPKNNTNAEKWTEADANSFFDKALELSKSKDYDFMGEIAREMDSYLEVFDYLIEKFPHLAKVKNHIKRNCEANCFSNIKKGAIREASGIMNLKSNHGWKDRSEVDLNANGKLTIDPKQWVE